MSNISNDIIDEIEINPNKAKRIIKIIVGFALSSITIAFFIGKFFMGEINEREKIKTNNEKIIELDGKLDNNINNLNSRIDKIYDDGYETLIIFQEYNKRELELIIDYGTSNKELLKKILNINDIEKGDLLKNKIEIAKKNNTSK